ncbi:unnamed protein product, partial [marine sediment metagenome]
MTTPNLVPLPMIYSPLYKMSPLVFAARPVGPSGATVVQTVDIYLADPVGGPLYNAQRDWLLQYFALAGSAGPYEWCLALRPDLVSYGQTRSGSVTDWEPLKRWFEWIPIEDHQARVAEVEAAGWPVEWIVEGVNWLPLPADKMPAMWLKSTNGNAVADRMVIQTPIATPCDEFTRALVSHAVDWMEALRDDVPGLVLRTASVGVKR